MSRISSWVNWEFKFGHTGITHCTIQNMQLWQHQREAVDFAMKNFCPRVGPPKGVVFAHEMGLGKTLSAVATIAEMARRGKVFPCVLACPLSMMEHWKKTFNEYEKFHGFAEIMHQDHNYMSKLYVHSVICY